MNYRARLSLVFILLVIITTTFYLKGDSEVSYLQPQKYEILVSPYNTTKILDYLANAKTAIYMEVYVLTYYPLAELLANKAKSGVQVYVVLSRDVYGGIPSSEYNITNFLRENGVNITFLDTKFKYVHSKVYVIDNETTIISNQNPTYSGFFSNLGVTLVIKNSTIARWFASIILNDFHNYFPDYNYPGLVISPINSYSQLKGLLSVNASSIYMAMEGIYNSSGLVNLILSHPQRYIVAARSDISNVVIKEGLTAKIIVVGDYVYIGSINLSGTSIRENRELGIIIKDPNLANAMKSLILKWYGAVKTNTTTTLPKNTATTTTSTASSLNYFLILLLIVVIIILLLLVFIRRFNR